MQAASLQQAEHRRSHTPGSAGRRNLRKSLPRWPPLRETQASDESLWTGIALNEGYDYMMYRWGFDHSTKFEYRWNFYTKGKRGYIHHGIARLWWFAHMTFDASRNDPYELTEYGLINQSYFLVDFLLDSKNKFVLLLIFQYGCHFFL